MDIAWLLLVIAGVLEPCWIYTMEKSDSFRDIRWTVLTVLVLIADLYLLSVAMQTIGAGMSYAIWTGIGAIGAVVMGVFVYKEKATVLRVFLIMLIIIGITGLNLTAGDI
ncbi:MAG: multidrug efflux SMR transporter [Candidatus Methanomethylophilaceae archaeon]|nr:multidrug efflux SMR transporter [Candidatus Methanomethylophilaceae archaeon]